MNVSVVAAGEMSAGEMTVGDEPMQSCGNGVVDEGEACGD